MKSVKMLVLASCLIGGPAMAAPQDTYTYVVKGGVCVDGSAFNEAESLPLGGEFVIPSNQFEEVRKAVTASKGEFFFLRGDERNLFIRFKSGRDFEYKSGRAPCPNEGISIISLERVTK